MANPRTGPPRAHGHACWHPPTDLARTAIPRANLRRFVQIGSRPDRGYIERPPHRAPGGLAWTGVDSAVARAGKPAAGRPVCMVPVLWGCGATVFACPSVTGFLRATGLRWRHWAGVEAGPAAGRSTALQRNGGRHGGSCIQDAGRPSFQSTRTWAVIHPEFHYYLHGPTHRRFLVAVKRKAYARITAAVLWFWGAFRAPQWSTVPGPTARHRRPPSTPRFCIGFRGRISPSTPILCALPRRLHGRSAACAVGTARVMGICCPTPTLFHACKHNVGSTHQEETNCPLPSTPPCVLGHVRPNYYGCCTHVICTAMYTGTSQ
ncbi:hypothetical protein HYPSUDRAFT_1033011 [Hypholoma sublateritium FD-334 SS-4]|uniref:Uncharacterized protein n=1 Tax=Hypholoma sublateritium (strain FD-334 SS-4) TaxID=945553 RepID=A0A0D2P7B0_HYPSF|nr:hypothetical protein HYPSUDRAFT_1033011 [Hypholoma sublateritium FD-334 SS-4]